jgi:flagellar hook-associated protein 1 FlgK
VVSAANTLSAFYVRLQDLFGTPENNSSIAGQLNELRSALEKLAVDSQQSVAQSTAVTSAEDVVNTLHTISTIIQGMRQEVDRQIGDGIDKINAELVNIDKLNVDIVRNKTLDQPTGELEDKRDMALKTIAEQMDVKWFTERQ